MSAPRIVASGLRFPEGPTWLGDGAVVVAEMQGEAVARVDADGTVTRVDLGGGPTAPPWTPTGRSTSPTTVACLTAGRGFWHAPRSFDGCVQRIGPDGTVTTEAADLPGPAPHRPNDICVAPDGALIVTDSADWEQLPDVPIGRVLALADGDVRVLAELPAMPNGVAFAPGGDILYVAQSLTRKDPGVRLPRRRGGRGPHGVQAAVAAAGRAVRRDGRPPDRVRQHRPRDLRFDPDGTLQETIEAPPGSQPTNCCLGNGALYVTLSVAGELAAYDLDVAAAGGFAIVDERRGEA